MTSKTFKTTSSRWSALQTRDPAAASSFIYSVISTRIYCRPNCPSRLARRANIVFHDTTTEAEAAGFRPCKRCRPELTAGDPDADLSLLMVEKVKAMIGKEGMPGEKEKWSVKELAVQAGLTESHFCRTFKRRVGMTVGTYRSRIQNQSTENTVMRQQKEDDMIPCTTSSNHCIAHQDQSSQFHLLDENQPALQLSQNLNMCSSSTTTDLLNYGKGLDFSNYMGSLLDCTNYVDVPASQESYDCFQYVDLDCLV